MIYLDNSVVLSCVSTELNRPAAAFRDQGFVSSRILQHAAWNRIHVRRSTPYRHGLARKLLSTIGYLELTPEILARPLRPLQAGVQLLDGLRLASAAYLAGDRPKNVVVASDDRRMVQAAVEMGFDTNSP